VPYPESFEVAGARLRRWDAERDLEILEALSADPDVTRYLTFLLEGGLEHRSSRYADHWDEHGFGLWAVCLGSGAPAGWVGAVHPRWHPEYAEQVELAWALLRPARGRGLATTAARTAAAACFSGLGLPELLAFVDPTNTRSRAVADRLGFRPTGSTTAATTGQELDVLMLAPADLT